MTFTADGNAVEADGRIVALARTPEMAREITEALNQREAQSSSGSGHRPFTAETGVQVPAGSTAAPSTREEPRACVCGHEEEWHSVERWGGCSYVMQGCQCREFRPAPASAPRPEAECPGRMDCYALKAAPEECVNPYHTVAAPEPEGERRTPLDRWLATTDPIERADAKLDASREENTALKLHARSLDAENAALRRALEHAVGALCHNDDQCGRNDECDEPGGCGYHGSDPCPPCECGAEDLNREVAAALCGTAGAALLSRMERLRDAALHAGGSDPTAHLSGCDLVLSSEPCDCGMDRLRAALDPEEGTRPASEGDDR